MRDFPCFRVLLSRAPLDATAPGYVLGLFLSPLSPRLRGATPDTPTHPGPADTSRRSQPRTWSWSRRRAHDVLMWESKRRMAEAALHLAQGTAAGPHLSGDHLYKVEHIVLSTACSRRAHMENASCSIDEATPTWLLPGRPRRRARLIALFWPCAPPAASSSGGPWPSPASCPPAGPCWCGRGRCQRRGPTA